MHEELGDIGRSRALHEENLTRARELGNRFIESQSLGALAYQAAEEGRTSDAVSMLEGVLRIDRDEGSNLQSTLDLTRFARVLALAGGRPEDATRLLSCADARREDIGVSTPPPYVSTLRDEAVTAIRQELDADSFTEAWELGRMLTLDEAFALALGEAEPDA